MIAKYPTFQVFLAVFVAAILVLICMPIFIRFMRHENIGQQIRADGPQAHFAKQGTPTMGGLIILIAAAITVVLLAWRVWTLELGLVLAVTLLTALIGLADDVESVTHQRSLGLTAGQKMIGLVLLSVGFCLFAVNACHISPAIRFPGGFTIDLGVLTTHITIAQVQISIPWLYIFFIFLLMAGMSNSVNLTDGLDGLAGSCITCTLAVMAMIAFKQNMISLAIFAGALAGACIGFLWFNSYPASIFMGDTGSLALGAAFAALAVMTKSEIVSLVVGFVFIAEALSDVIQVTYFRATGKRVFLMAPLHHHFEKKGWPETKIVMRFTIIAAAFAALGFVLFFLF